MKERAGVPTYAHVLSLFAATCAVCRTAFPGVALNMLLRLACCHDLHSHSPLAGEGLSNADSESESDAGATADAAGSDEEWSLQAAALAAAKGQGKRARRGKGVVGKKVSADRKKTRT